MVDFNRLILNMKNAKETPTEKCGENDIHEFKFLLHADGSECFSNYFKCSKCDETIVQRTNRTGLNKRLWAKENE